MKKIVLLAMLICTWANAESNTLEPQSEVKTNSIYVYKGENGTYLSTKDSQEDESTFKKYERLSVIPTYHADMNKWENAGCKVDRFNGKKSCEVRNDRLYVVNLSGKNSVLIIGADFPKKQSAIKIDENATIYGTEGSFKNNQIIINQLLKGNKAYLRYVQWPYLHNQDLEIDLSGFKEAYQQMMKEYTALK